MLKNIILLAIAVTLTGCMFTAGLHYEPVTRTDVSNLQPVFLSVIDQRKFVLSGDKSPSFLGKFRAGFADIKDVYTETKVPLADHLKQDLLKELRSLGFEEQASKDSRSITVTIQDWNSDGFVNVNFWYEVAVSVASPEGNVLARSVIKGERQLKGNFFMGGGLGAIQEGMPIVYGEIIKALVRDNEEVFAALKDGRVSTSQIQKNPVSQPSK